MTQKKHLTGLALIIIMLTTLACSLTSAPAANTAVPPTLTSAPSPVNTPTVVDAAATTQALKENTQATQAAKEKAAMQAATQTASAQAAAEEEASLAETTTAEAAVTQQAEGMYSVVQSLKDDGVLKNTSGTYQVIEDFKEEWAQIGWYQWWSTGYQPQDFVISAHTAWESASKTADWYAAGCGFVFHAKDENNHYLIYLALDGNVYMKGYVDSKFRELGREYVGKINNIKGEADVILAVQGEKIVYYVNGKKVFERKNKEIPAGDLGLTLVSGTNKDYGTRCEMTDVELWELNP